MLSVRRPTLHSTANGRAHPSTLGRARRAPLTRAQAGKADDASVVRWLRLQAVMVDFEPPTRAVITASAPCLRRVNNIGSASTTPGQAPMLCFTHMQLLHTYIPVSICSTSALCNIVVVRDDAVVLIDKMCMQMLLPSEEGIKPLTAASTHNCSQLCQLLGM